MDDYPRGPPHAGELHLDLISWMAFFSQTMRDIAEFVGEVDDATAFDEIAKATIDNIDGRYPASIRDRLRLIRHLDLHWSEEDQMYCDVGVNDEGKSPSALESDRKSTRLNSSHSGESRMPSSA